MQKLVSAVVMGVFLVLGSTPASAADHGSPGFESFQDEVRDVGDIEVTVGSKSIVVSWQGISLGPNISAFLRDKVDGLDGNEPDGAITEEEAENAELLIRQYVQNEFDQYAHDEAYSGYLVIDSTIPKGAQVDSLVASGITGDVNSTDGIALSFVTTIGFPTRSADVHTVKLDMGRYYFKAVDESQAQSVVGDFSLKVRAAEGWSIDTDTIQPQCAQDAFSEGAMVFTAEDVNCFTERAGVLMGFSITGHDESGYNVPGFEAPLVALALVGMGLVLRRRA